MKPTTKQLGQKLDPQIEEKIKQICQEIIINPYIAIETLEKTVGLSVEPILDDIARKLEQVGITLQLIELHNIAYLVPLIVSVEADLQPETLAVLGVLGTMQNMFGRTLKETEINHYFDQVKSKITELERKTYVRQTPGRNWEITPLGYAVLGNVTEQLPYLIKEYLHTSQ